MVCVVQQCSVQGIDTGQRTRSMASMISPLCSKSASQLQGRVLLDETITTVNMNFDYLAGGVHTDGYIDYEPRILTRTAIQNLL